MLVMPSKTFVRVLVVIAACASSVAVAADTRTYSADLATLFNETQRVVAVRDACITAQPAKRL